MALPGLIDAHTHMTYGWDGAPGTTPFKQGQRTPAERMQLALANARKTLETGVTTVRDLGAGGGLDITLRDEIAAGRMIGPRMFVSGQGISAGRGGGAPDPAAMQKTTEARLATTADWVKVYASRGSYQSVDTTQTIFFDELKAIVDTAHAKGRKVAIHSYGASGVKDAVRAGADTVEHGIELDDETMAEMVKRRTIWVPTVDHNRYYVDAKDEFQFAPDTIPPLQAYIEKNLDAVRRAAKAGVRLAMGSDAVYSMFGQNTRELGVVRQGRHDAGAGAAHRDDDRRRDARRRGSPRPPGAGLSRRHHRGRRQPAREDRRVVHRRPVGDEETAPSSWTRASSRRGGLQPALAGPAQAGPSSLNALPARSAVPAAAPGSR